MKQIVKKVLIIFIIILTLTEFIFQTNISNATNPPVNDENSDIKPEMINSIINLAGGIVSIVHWNKRIMLTVIAYTLDQTLLNVVKMNGDKDEYGDDFKILTPYDIFFNKFQLLDVNFFDLDGVNAEANKITYPIRVNVSGWFYTMRLIASIILLCILIYVGIRMAIASVAEEKAKYKKMLIDWACSLALIYVLHYMAVFIIYFNNIVVSALNELIGSSTLAVSDLNKVYSQVAKLATLGVGITSITATIVYCAMIFVTISFFIAYINRMIKVGFLIIISPLISLTYSIDKMGDGKAQALGNWLKEFIFTILIQPFHCIMYVAFANTAFTLMSKFLPQGNGVLAPLTESLKNTVLGSSDYNLLANGVLVILCLVFIKQAEDIIRRIFGFSDDNKSTSFGAGMAMGVLAVKNAGKIGKSTRMGVNKARNTLTRFNKVVKSDYSKIANTRFGKAIGNSSLGKTLGSGASKVNNLGKGANKWVKNTGAVKLAKRGISGVSKAKHNFTSSKIGGYLARKNSTASVLGSLAGIASVMGGDNIIEAYGESKAVEQGASQFLNTSTSHLAEEASEANSKLDEEEYETQVEAYNSKSNDPNRDPVEEALSDIGMNEAGFKARQKADNDRDVQRGIQKPSYAKRVAEKRVEAKRLKKEGIQELLASGQSGPNATNQKLMDAQALEAEANDLEKLAKVESLMYEREVLRNFFTTEAGEARAYSRMHSPSKKDIAKAARELMAEIAKLNRLSTGNVNVNQNNVLTPEETKTAKATSKTLSDVIQHSVLSDSRHFNLESTVRQYTGIQNGANGAQQQQFDQVVAKAKSIEKLYRQQKVASVFSAHMNLSGDPEKLSKKIAEKSNSLNIDKVSF